MATTTSDFYRALMGEMGAYRIRQARGTDTVASVYPGDGVLYPRWTAKERRNRDGSTAMRDGRPIVDRADVTFAPGAGGVPMVQPGGGTSLHDVPGWFGSKEFKIPSGTEYSDEIFIRIDAAQDHPRQAGVRGRHAQLEAKNPMTQTTFAGYLDVMARNAVVKQIADAGARTPVRG